MSESILITKQPVKPTGLKLLVSGLLDTIRGGANLRHRPAAANALIGAEVLATNAVRTVDGKGRHTTVHRELFPLPSGGALIDTPGLRGIGLWDAADGIELAWRSTCFRGRLCAGQGCFRLRGRMFGVSRVK